MSFVPNMGTLAGKTGLRFHFGLPVAFSKTTEADLEQIESPVKMLASNTEVRLEPSTSASKGIWIPYQQNRCIYGYAGGGTKWIGSGPFSGCHVAFFMKNGRLAMAHVAVDGSGDAMEAWNGLSSTAGIRVLNKWKVPLAINGTQNMGTYLFLDLSDPASISLTQMDVLVQGMGGYQGTISKVTKVIG